MIKRKTLPEVLAERVVSKGDLTELLQDAVLRQDMRWLRDQAAGRRSQV